MNTSLTASQRALIDAALAGDRGPMDRAELNYLRFAVRPHFADGEVPCGDIVEWRFSGPGRETLTSRYLHPTELRREPGGLRVVWGWAPPCGRCCRRYRVDPTCTRCGGVGHLADDGAIEDEYLTDIDGLILEEL